MKSITKRKSLILLSVGMLVISVSQILSHYVELSDLGKGTLVGIGIGFVFLALFLNKPETVQ